MKSLVDLLEHLLHDCGRRSGAPVARDVKTLRQRVKHEGDSFITITLPNFCRDFERSLDEGRIASGAFLSFRKTRTGIPAFLQGFLRNVFDADGALLAAPSIDCIRSVRQICLFGKKVERPCSDTRNSSAVDGYIQCDENVVDPPEGQMLRYFRQVARHIMSSFGFSRDYILENLMPKHGPGATQERIFGNQKWRFKSWHQRLSDVGFTPKASIGFDPEECPETGLRVLDPGEEPPVRVVLVPKTQKTPRVIAVEPVCMQFLQQGLLQLLVPAIEKSRFTAGRVNFTDQSVNQRLALSSSSSGIHATIDMSEASDRVSVAHVRELLMSTPFLRDAAFATRTGTAELPSGDVISLRKFASMGSALCFPMEALVFFSTIVASRILRAGFFPSAHHVYSFSRDVYVYGDDIIVPADEAPAICADLESFGFKVNKHKSFWTGKFRESCGSDCYDNELVTPVYLRRDLPAVRGDAAGIVSSIETCNQLEKAGYLSTATVIRDAVERLIGQLPHIDDAWRSQSAKPIFVNGSWVVNPLGTPALGWTSFSGKAPPRRWDPTLQRWLHRVWVAVSTRCEDILDGYPALAKCFRLIGREVDDEKHLAESSRRYGLTLKRRWVPVLK